MGERLLVQRKRPRAREDKPTAGTTAQVVEQGAEETPAGHRFSDIDVFPREEQSDNGYADHEPLGIERASDLDGSSLATAPTEIEAEPDLQEEHAQEAPRGHRFSDIDVFPRQDHSENGSGHHAAAGIERAGGLDHSTIARADTEIEPETDRQEEKQEAAAEAIAVDTVEERAAHAGTERVGTVPAGPPPPPSDTTRLTSSNGAAGTSPPTLSPDTSEVLVQAVSSASGIGGSPQSAGRWESGIGGSPQSAGRWESGIGTTSGAESIEAGRKIETGGKIEGELEHVESVEAKHAEGVEGKHAESVEGGKGVKGGKGVEGAEEIEGGKGAAEADAEAGAPGGKGAGRATGADQAARAGGQARGGGVGGGRGGGGGGGGEAADTAGAAESLGDAALDRWTAATSAATEAVPAPELPEGQAAAAAVGDAATAVVNEREAAEPDYESEAKDAQEPVPEAAEKEAQLDTSEADQALADVKALADKRLSPATFSPTGAPPPYPGLNPRDFVPARDLKVLEDLEKRLAGTDLSAAERASLTKQLEKVQAHIAGIEEAATKGTAPPAALTVVDEGASSLEPPSPDQAAVLGDAIARAITSIPGRGMALAMSAAQPLDQGKSPELQELAKGKADTVESEMREELEQIASAAGVSAEQLTGKIAEQQAAAAALAAEQDEATKRAADKGVEARSRQGVEEQAQISGAKQAVEKEIAATESAADGPPDTEAIEAKRDELLGKLERTGSEVLASYRSSLEKRTGELNEASGKQKGEIRGAADRQAAAIRRHFPDDPEKGAVESLPTKNWATTAAQQVDVESGRFSNQATTENKGFIDALNEQLSTARTTVRDWAAHQEGRERSWWEQLIDMIRDWGKQASRQQRGVGTPAGGRLA